MSFPSAALFCLLALLFPGETPATAATCDKIGTAGLPAQLPKIGQDVRRKIELQALDNPAKFCADNLKARYFGAHRSDFAKLGVLRVQGVGFEMASERLIRVSESDPWGMTLLPDKDARLEALDRSVSISRIDDQSFAKSRPRTDVQLASARKFFTTVDAAKAEDAGKLFGGAAVVKAFEFVACAQLTLRGVSKCVRGLNEVQTLMSPKIAPGGFGLMTDFADWKSIFSDHRYEEGIRLTAKRMQSAATAGHVAPTENIYDMLTSSFQTSKMTLPQAKDAAFKVLGVLANGGPNTLDRLRSMEGANIEPNPPMSQLSQGLILISNAMPLLDTLKQEKGFPLFSLPKEVKATCDNGKSYHFWMAAILARKLVAEKNFDPKTAASSTFVAEKAYQIVLRERANSAVSNLGTILAQDPFSPVANVVRTDLAYSASGAFFGASVAAGKENHINIDESLRSLVRQAPIDLPPSLSDAQSLVKQNKLSAIQKWDAKFVPNAAFDSVKEANPL